MGKRLRGSVSRAGPLLHEGGGIVMTLGYETGNTIYDTGYTSPPTGTQIDSPTLVIDYPDYLVEIRCPYCDKVLKPHKCGESG